MKSYTKLEFSLKGTFDNSLSLKTLTSQYSISVIAQREITFSIFLTTVPVASLKNMHDICCSYLAHLHLHNSLGDTASTRQEFSHFEFFYSFLAICKCQTPPTALALSTFVMKTTTSHI